MIQIHSTSQTYIDESIVSPSSKASIVNRRGELALLMNYYEAAKKGSVQVVLVSGEAGIGKTRLLNELVRRTFQDGALVLRGKASNAEGMPFYLPFLEALDQYIRETAPDELQKQVTPATQVLTSILPELSILRGSQPVSCHLSPEQDRFRFYKAVGALLENIALSQVLVLEFDDLQWADSASLDLLCYITRYLTKARLLILGACRASEIVRNPLLERAVEELTHQRVLTIIDVPPLALEDIEKFAPAILGGPASSDLCSLLYAESEGNPFFAEELLRSWIKAGTLTQENGLWMINKPHEPLLPPGIVGILRQRFLQLSPGMIDHLRIAAIIGRTFDLSLLATIEELEIETLEECLVEAEHAGLIRSIQRGVFTFCHHKIRECLYAEVRPSRRRRIHEAIGCALESQYNRGSLKKNSQLTQLALHFMHKNEGGQSVLPATQAQRRTVVMEAAAHYAMALELLAKEDQRRGPLLLKLGNAELLASHEEEAAIAYQDGLVIFSQLEDFKAAARAAHGLGLARWRQGRLSDALIAMEHALRLLEGCSCIEAADMSLDLSMLLTVSLGKQTEGLAYAQQSLEIAQLLGDTDLVTMAKQAVAGNHFVQGSELLSIVQSEEQALKLAQTNGDFLEIEEYCFSLTRHHYWLSEIARSYELSLQQMKLIECSELPLPCYVLTAYSWPVLLLASQGKWTQAEHLVKKAHTAVDHLASPLPLAFLQQVQGFLAYQQEDYMLAEREFRAAERHEQSYPGEPMFFCGLPGLVLVGREKYDEACAYMARLENLLSSFPTGTLPTAPIAMCMALLAVALDDWRRFPDLYTRLLAFRGQHYWFLVDRVLGLIAARRGEKEAAVHHLAAAEATARREGLRPELGRIYQAQANIELAQGDSRSTSQAQEMLKQALAIFKELGMTASSRQCCHQLHAASSQRRSCPRPAPLRSSANLTWREEAVLKLVAGGKSNCQIAHELGISEKTVANHLTHIFNKTGCENRAAATAFAIHHDLA